MYSTVCPRSSYPLYTVIYYIKWVTTCWTYSTSHNKNKTHAAENINTFTNDYHGNSIISCPLC